MAPALHLQGSLFLGPLVEEGTFEQKPAHTKNSCGEQNRPAEKSGHLSQLFEDELGDIVVGCGNTGRVGMIMDDGNVAAEGGNGLREVSQHRSRAENAEIKRSSQ